MLVDRPRSVLRASTAAPGVGVGARRRVLSAWLVIGGLACGAQALPRVVPSDLVPPDKDITPALAALQCTAASGAFGSVECKPGSPLLGLDCTNLERSPWSSGLRPEGALLVCLKMSYASLEATEYVRAPRGMMPVYTRFVAVDATGPHLLKSMADLRAHFAPIDTPVAALSFVLAVTDHDLLRGFTPPAGYRYFVSELRETTVERTATGFLVRNLEDPQIVGCGPHTMSLVDVAVTSEGVVTETGRRKAFEDPRQDNLCLD
jgi:hypothetical protein